MDKEEFLKINVINDFISYISKKNYSVNTYTSYINDLYYFYIFLFRLKVLVLLKERKNFFNKKKNKFFKIIL